MTKTTKKSWRAFGLAAVGVVVAALSGFGLENVDFISDQLSGPFQAALIPAYVGLLEYARNYFKHGG